MRNRFLLVLFLSSCAGSAVTTEPAPECELGTSRPLSVMAKRRGEVYVERTVSEGCEIKERLIWKRSSLPIAEPGWQAGELSIWRGQLAVDLHKFFDGHPVECKTWLYKFSKNKLRLVKKNKTCGP